MIPVSTLIGRAQVAIAINDGHDDELLHQGILAGLLAASRALLTPAEFDRLVADCTIDPIDLETLLPLAEGGAAADSTIDL